MKFRVELVRIFGLGLGDDCSSLVQAALFLPRLWFLLKNDNRFVLASVIRVGIEAHVMNAAFAECKKNRRIQKPVRGSLKIAKKVKHAVNEHRKNKCKNVGTLGADAPHKKPAQASAGNVNQVGRKNTQKNQVNQKRGTACLSVPQIVQKVHRRLKAGKRDAKQKAYDKKLTEGKAL